jgi:hypothetical protein
MPMTQELEHSFLQKQTKEMKMKKCELHFLLVLHGNLTF